MKTAEWQFDGLVGPTHNYAGLAPGNLASDANRGRVSNPRAAALQGLKKMRYVRDLGVPQAFVPPQLRPLIPELEMLGFQGSTETLLKSAYELSPSMLASVFSSSFMWVANLATVAPSADTEDGKLHFTPANLVSHYHRAIELPFSQRILAKIFHNKEKFVIHNALRSTPRLGDEGAANHMRICDYNKSFGSHIFVYGAGINDSVTTSKYIARQTLESSQSVARLHRLNTGNSLFIRQAPDAIDQGVFHNDVIAMNTTRRMIYHEDAFVSEHVSELHKFCAGVEGMKIRSVSREELSIPEAVSTYLFNSQLLALEDESFALIAPKETEEQLKAGALVNRLIGEGVLDSVHYLDVRESMRNGGGPACLRLRVVMTAEEAAAMHQGIILTDATLDWLTAWVERYYRDRLTLEDLRDAAFVRELWEAYEALEQIIGMPGLYTELM